MKRLITPTLVLSTLSVSLAKEPIRPLDGVPDAPPVLVDPTQLGEVIHIAQPVKPAASGATTKPASPQNTPTTQKVDTLGPGKRITLSLKNASAKQAFAELEKQSGYKLTVAPPNLLDNASGGIDLEVKDRPWLEIVTELSQKAGVTVMPTPQWMITQHFGQRMMGGRMYYTGPVAVGVRALTVDADVQYGGKEALRRTVIVLNCTLMTEPGIGNVSPSSASIVDEVLDEQGKPIPLLPPDRTVDPVLRSFGFPGGFDLPFVLPPGAGKRLTKVQGRVFADMVVGSAELKIKDVLNEKGSTADLSGWRFQVRPQAQGPNWTVELRVPRDDKSSALLSLQQGGAGNYQPRTSSAGVRAHFMNVQVEGNDVVLRVMILRQGQVDQEQQGPVDLTWPLPAEIRRVEIPFEFKDLPVPQ